MKQVTSTELTSELIADTSPTAPSSLTGTLTGGLFALSSNANATSDLTGQSFGQYRILSTLGRGGMGVVYLALDEVLDRKVVLKLLPQEFTGDPNRVRRFVQEAKAASALNHPNIVSIHGLGESNLGQFIVMELVEGSSLRSHCGQPMPCATLLDVWLQTARALQATHAAGLIHRDMKPENIMLRPDGIIKVLDFGLARLVGPVAELADTTALTAPGVIVGTVMYMSPEQARGEWITCASDIFSLGIVLYELCTGLHPFAAASALGYLQAITSREVEPPSSIVAGIPDFVDSLLLRMLHKAPAQRCTATDLVEALRPSSTNAASVTSPGTLPSGQSPTSPMVGRQKEREELLAQFRAARSGRGCVVCVSGEPGLGKTTLVESFLAELAADGSAAVGRGRCSERMAGTEAYLPILEVMEGLLNGPNRNLVPTLESSAPSWLAQLGRSGPGEIAVSPTQEQLKREMAIFLSRASSVCPIVLFLDDIHWADASTVDLLSYLSNRLDGMRVLIVASYRTSELYSGSHSFLRLQLDMVTRRVCKELPLPFLTLEDVAAYVAFRFPASTFPGSFLDMIHARTEGNPLFVADLLGYLVDQGSIRKEERAWILTRSVSEMQVGLPESVRSMVQRKMDQLADTDRTLLRAASVQGAQFDTCVLARALGEDPADLEETLERLERTTAFVQPVQEYAYADGTLTLRYRFVHVLYQNAFYGSLKPSRRASLSGQVAESLLSFHGAHADRIAAQLAFLFESARVFERASFHYLVAAKNALQLYANREAESLARRGIELAQRMEEGESRSRRELVLNQVLAGALRNLRSHSSDETLAVRSRLFELATELNDHLTLFQFTFANAWAEISHQAFGNAEQVAVRCLEIADESKDPCLRSAAHMVYGNVLFHTGNLRDAEHHLEIATQLHKPEHAAYAKVALGTDPAAHALALLSAVCAHTGRVDRARALQKEGLARSIAAQNLISQCSVLICVLASYRLLEDGESLIDALKRLLEICGKCDLHESMTLFARYGEGLALTHDKNPEGALAKFDEAISGAKAIQMKYMLPIFTADRARAMGMAGRSDEAIVELREQIREATADGHRSVLPELYLTLGQILAASGADRPSAEESLRAALEMSRDTGAHMLQLYALTTLAELHRDDDDWSGLRSELADAVAALTGGSDLPVVRRANALLGESSRRVAVGN